MFRMPKSPKRGGGGWLSWDSCALQFGQVWVVAHVEMGEDPIEWFLTLQVV